MPGLDDATRTEIADAVARGLYASTHSQRPGAQPGSYQGDSGLAPPWWTDPTKNVETLVSTSERRQDDLREMQAGYVRQIGEMREVHAAAVADLRATYDGQLREAARRSEERLDYKDQQLRAAETARIDAIRAVDVGAVNRAAEVSATQAATLATQVATSAEALRGQVEAARQQTATALAAALEPIQKDIQDLRRAQYEAQGQKITVTEAHTDTRADAAILAAERAAQESRQRATIGIIIAAMSVLVLIIAILIPHLH